MKYLFSLLVLLLIPPPLFSQEEVTVKEVMVWVKATDGSRKAVAGLTQADFEIFEDGKKMAPTCFEETELSLPQGAAPAPETAQTQTAEQTLPVKRVAVIVDLYGTQQAEYLYIKPKVMDFLKQIPSNWEIMLASLIPGAIQVNVPFTKDIKSFEAKLESITANLKRDQDVLNRRRQIMNILAISPSQKIVQDALLQAQEFAIEEKHMARESIKALGKFEQDLVRWKLDSHMVAVLISGGIDAEPGKQYFDLIERRAGARDSLQAVRESNADLWSMLRKMVAQLNRHNITFYTINTRGVSDPAPDNTLEPSRNRTPADAAYLDDLQELMAEIADETGGVYFENSLNFRRGFDLILTDLDRQYLICYKAPDHKKENEIHKIKVETKKPGVKLRYRKEYLD